MEFLLALPTTLLNLIKRCVIRMPTYVVTGASSGLGLELVKQLAARGDTVYAIVRKKQSSATGVDLISQVPGNVTIVEGIDVTKDDCGVKLKAAITGQIDCLIHNAGGINASRDAQGMAVMSEQKLDAVTPQLMMETYQLNTIGPLRVQQALNAQIASPGGKVAVISTGMGSISDNGSGGLYAYRSAKAGVNMLAKGISCDLKDKGIAVVSIAPGMVLTEFGPGKEMLAKMGAMTPEMSVAGLVQIIDAMSMETTGKFMAVKKDGTVGEFSAGW